MASRLKITTKKGELVAFSPNDAQMVVYRAMEAQRERGLPVRLIILKARQRGISTGIEADFFTQVYHKPNRHAAVIAHLAKATQEIFEMSQRFEEHLPANERRPMRFVNRNELTFGSPHSSWFRVMTSGEGEQAKKTGRSMVIHYLHYSEVAFCGGAKQVLTAAMQCIPEDDPDTAVVLESTANGIGGEFWARWTEAVKYMKENPGDLTGFLPIFLSWLDQPEYRRAVPEGYVWGNLSDDEKALQALGADDEQLCWRRWKILGAFNGDTDLFKQEFPSTPSEAFVASGRPAMPSIIVGHHRSTCEPECTDYVKRGGLGYRKCNLHWDRKFPRGVRPEYGDHILEPCWHIWRTPSDYTDYVVAGDIARGELSDPQDEKSVPDWSTGFAMDRTSLGQVAEYRGRPLPSDMGSELLKACYWYQKAWGTPEVNDAGRTALEKFRQAHYARTFRRRIEDARLDVRHVTHLGWETTSGNRKYLIDGWLEHCKPDELGSWEGTVVIRSDRLVDEEETFIYRPNGKREHREGCHDDILFAAMIALRLHLSCPRTLQTPQMKQAKHDGRPRHGEIDWGVDAIDRNKPLETR